MSQHGQPESPRSSQSQHKTPKRDALYLVPFGTREQDKWGNIGGIVCLHSVPT